MVAPFLFLQLLLSISAALFAPPAPAAFSAPVTYSVGSQPRALVLADVNGDGRPDIITANEARSRTIGGGGDSYAMGIGALLPNFSRRSKNTDVGTVTVLLAQPNGSFAPAQSYPVGRFPTALAVADLNQDGRPDLLTADTGFQYGHTFTVVLGQAGGFGPPAAYPGPFVRTSESLVLTDLTGDNSPDVISVNSLPDNGGVSRGAGVEVGVWPLTANLGARLVHPTGHYNPRSLALADVTGDGRPDAVVTDGEGYSIDSAVVVLPGLGQGRFSAPLTYVTERGPTVLADVNGDGRPDLVAVSAHAIGVRLCGPQGFGPATRYPGLGEEPIAATLADLNGDGHPDLLTNHYTYQQDAQGRVQVRLGRPEGGWNPPTTYSVGTHSAERFAVADLNGDSRPDLVTLNRNTSTVSVLLAH